MAAREGEVSGSGSGSLSAHCAPRAPARVALMTGFPTLFYKEVLRFWKVALQTVAAPVLTTLLYLIIFGHVMDRSARVYGEVSYVQFLVPGLVMMSLLQNAFANSSSSLMQSKMTGNIIFVLLPPLAHWEFFAAYELAAIVRGIGVGAGVLAVTLPFVDLYVRHPLWVIAFALVGSAILGALGLIAAILADKFDQVAAFQNFLIMPLTFLSGVFYSIHSLPEFWQDVSHFNPVFYMIDGFRYGFFGVSDVDPLKGFAVVVGCFAAVTALTLAMLKSGYKLRN